MRRFLLSLFLPLIIILLLSGCGPDYHHHGGYAGTGQSDLYGTFELSANYSTIGCSYDFTGFLDANYGYILQPDYLYIDIIPDGYNAIDVWIEDLGISVIAEYDFYTGLYYGIWWDSALISDCQIDESIELWIEDTGYEIYVDIINNLSNSPYGYYCPFYDNSCENTISYVGYAY